MITRLLGVLLGINLIQITSGCSCRLSSVSDQFCSADYAIKAKVLSDRITTSRQVTNPYDNFTYTNREAHYRINVQHILKEDEVLSDVQKLKYYADSSWDMHVYTGPSGGACGVHLMKGEIYLLTGGVWKGKAHISLCGLTSLYSHERVSAIVRNGRYNCYFWIIILGFILIVLTTIIVVLVICRNKCGAPLVPMGTVVRTSLPVGTLT